MAFFPAEGWACESNGAGLQITSQIEGKELSLVLSGDGQISIIGSEEKILRAPSIPDPETTLKLTLAVERRPKQAFKGVTTQTSPSSRQSTGKVTGKWRWLQGRGKGDSVMYLYVALRHSGSGSLVELQRPNMESIRVKETAPSGIVHFDFEKLQWMPCMSWTAPHLISQLEKGLGTVVEIRPPLVNSMSSPEPTEIALPGPAVQTQSPSLRGGNIRKPKLKRGKPSHSASPVAVDDVERSATPEPSRASSGPAGSEQLRKEHRSNRKRTAELVQQWELPQEAETVLFSQAGVHDAHAGSLHQAHWKMRHLELQSDGNVVYYQETRSASDTKRRELARVVLCALGHGACGAVESCDFQGGLPHGLVLSFHEGRHTVPRQHLAFSQALERSLWIEALRPFIQPSDALPTLPRTAKSGSSYPASTAASRPTPERTTIHRWANTKWFAHFVDEADPTTKINVRRQIRRGDLRAPRTMSSLDFRIDMTAKALAHSHQQAMVMPDGSPMDHRAQSVMSMSPGAFRASGPQGSPLRHPPSQTSTSPALVADGEEEGRAGVLPAIVRAGRRRSGASVESEEEAPAPAREAAGARASPHAKQGAPPEVGRSPEGKFEDRCFTLLREMGLVRNRARRLRQAVDPDSSDSDEERGLRQRDGVRDMSQALLASPMFGYVYRRPLTGDSEEEEDSEALNSKEGLHEIVNWDSQGGLSRWLDDKVGKQQQRMHRQAERHARKQAEKAAGRRYNQAEGEAEDKATDSGRWAGWETEAEKAEAIITHFPPTWIRDAVAQMGEAAWTAMTWEEKLLAVQALLLDTNNLDLMLTDMTWKRDPLENTVQIKGKRMGELLYEIMELCVRSHDTRQVLALLESIGDEVERHKVGHSVAELASHGCLYDMVEDAANKLLFRGADWRRGQALKEAGYEFQGDHDRRRLRSPGSVEVAPLPERAARRLESRDRRRQVDRAPEKRAMSIRVELGMEDGEEQKDMFEEQLDALELEWEEQERSGRRTPSPSKAGDGEENNGRQSSRGGSKGSKRSAAEGADGDGSSRARRQRSPGASRGQSRPGSDKARGMTPAVPEEGDGGELQDELDDDREEDFGLTHEIASQIRRLLRDGKSLQDIQAEVKKTDGSDIDMEVLTELKEDWAGNLLKDFPIDHPIKIFCAKLMTLSLDIFMGKWRLWYIGRRRKRECIQQQYLSMCDFYHLTPVGVQSIHRYMLSRTSSSLNLSGQGFRKIGIKCLLEALSGDAPDEDNALMPDSVDICDLRAKYHFKPLTSLDLSSNDIQSEGAGLLAKFFVQKAWKIKALNLDSNTLREQGPLRLAPLLAPPTSKDHAAHGLVKLSLAKNSIGDRGVAILAKLLQENKHLRWLNLAGNSAGLNAGKALGEMVLVNNTLNYLDLSFNMLRTEGAVAFAEGVAQNNHLEEVILAWNGFGDPVPCAALGKAMETFFVKTLDVSYNRITKQGAMVLAVHLEKNSGIHRVVMDGNLISQGGARALFKAAKVASEGEDFAPEISVKECGIGIVDQQAFDPSEPSGEYDLDMKDSFSRGVLVNLFRNYAAGKGHFVPLVGKPEFNATLDDRPFLLELPKYDYADSEGKQVSIVNPDETEWTLPIEGILVFRFASIRVRDVSADALDSSSFNKMLNVFKDPEKSHAVRKEVMGMYLSLDTLVTFTQVSSLVEALYDKSHAENKDIRQSRAEIVAQCFHKLIDPSRGRELLKMLDLEARKVAERILGPSSFQFTRNNPTGYYHLNLAEAGDRAICMLLQEIRSLQLPRIRQLQKYYQGRTGGPRDELERVWRNIKVNGKAAAFDPAWKVPQSGTLDLDFVQIVRPGSGTAAIRDGSFEEMLQELRPLAAQEEEGELVSRLRARSDSSFFTCEQVYRVLCLVKKPNLRVEVLVIAYARLVDWHSFKMLEVVLSLPEQKQLRERIGCANLFDETTAVGYYELDLSDREQRFVAQEIVHLGHVEPGENMGECTFNDSDFDVPVGWVKDLPRSGLLQLYYIRDSDVVKQIRLQGAYDHGDSPMMSDAAGAWYGDELFGTFAPTWIRELRWKEGAELHEAAGEEWIKEHKLRRIQKKLEEKFPSSLEAIQRLDKDGSGEMSRAEIAIGLFQLGIWLRPIEMEALMSVLDEDNGGEVDQAEFHAFWERYSGKDDEEQFERMRVHRNDSTDGGGAKAGGGRPKRGSNCLRRGSVGGRNTLGVKMLAIGASKADLLADLEPLPEV